MTSPESRFEAVSRRAFLKRASALGVVALVPGLAACRNDEAAFASATTSTSAATVAPSTTDTPAPTSSTTSTQPPTTTEPAETPTTVAAVDTFPLGAELLVSFTYAVDGGAARIHNPYVAVWVEDSDGELVNTIALWFKQNRGTKWLPDLKRWYSVDGSSDTVSMISSATRVAGDYTLLWEGTDMDGNQVPLGEYYICVESAREQGPYSLIREPMTLSADPFVMELAPDEELSNASVELLA